MNMLAQRCRNANDAVSRTLLLGVSIALLSIYLLELIGGYYRQYTAFSIAFICVDLLSLILVVRFPYVGSILIIALWVVQLTVPPILPLSFTFAGMAATVILGYIDFPSAIAALLLTAGGLLIYPQTNLDSLVMFAATFLALAALGFMLRLHRDRSRVSAQLAVRQRQENIAEELHDVVCNDLAYALRRIDLLSGDARINQHQSAAESDALADIRNNVAEALQYAREAIATLKADDSDAAPIPEPATVSVDVRMLVDEQKEKLARAGFDGIVMLPDTLTLAMSTDRAAIIKGLIREIFGNILKHAVPAQGYVVTARTSATALHISASDTPLPSAIQNRHGGTGLPFYQDQLAALGGKLSVSRTDDQWTLEATIPLADGAAHTAE